MFNFSLLRSKKNKTVGEKCRMLELIDTIRILGLQTETQNFLNPITISLNSNNVIRQLRKFSKYRYRFVLEILLFSSNFENQTDVISLTCDGLSNAKEALINSKIEKVFRCNVPFRNWKLGNS